MRLRYMADVYRLAAKALQSGGIRRNAFLIVWDISGRCTAPFTTQYYGRPSRTNTNKWHTHKKVGQHSMCVDIITKCHKCETCLKERARLWTARAIQECNDSSRTWYGTLTLSPRTWMLALSRARVGEGRKGADFDLLPAAQRFALWNRQIQVEITKFFKRLRMDAVRAAGAPERLPETPIRYLLVTEAHQSGVPHYHLLVHEVLPGIPVRKAMLEKHWKMMGFSHWRLVGPHIIDTSAQAEYTPRRAAAYVCKYLQKSALARVRASQDYGVATLSGSLPVKGREVYRPRKVEPLATPILTDLTGGSNVDVPDET